MYVDHDPVVVSHARALLCRDPGVRAIEGDVRDPAGILDHPDLRAVIDLGEPVAVVLAAVLHFIPGEDSPHKLVDMLTAAMAPGSYLVISHATSEDIGPEAAAQVQELYAGTTAPAVSCGPALISPGSSRAWSWSRRASATSPPGTPAQRGRAWPDDRPWRGREKTMMQPGRSPARRRRARRVLCETRGSGDSPAHRAWPADSRLGPRRPCSAFAVRARQRGNAGRLPWPRAVTG